MKMKPIPVAPALVALLLSACGGGGGGDGDGGPSVVDSHVGTWSACLIAQGVPSLELIFDISKIDQNTASYLARGLAYTTGDCTGSSENVYSESGTWKFNGTKVASGVTVNKIDFTTTADTDPDSVEPRTSRDISYVSGNQVSFGQDSVSTDGYPSELSAELVFDRQ